MKKYLTISLILHLSTLFFINLPANEKQDPIDITIEENSNQKASGRNVQVKEVGDNGEGDAPKNHYWGIGVSGEYTYSPVGFSYHIKEVYKGYSAEFSGIRIGDFIFSVNGGSPAMNDISGDGPAKLVLQIYRNGVIMSINTERVRVYF